ncbi:hypothetical protein SLA2020_520640 [Shorea laevis]
MTSSKESKLESRSEALSISVVESSIGGEDEEQPLPLSSFHPKQMPADNRPRGSPRLLPVSEATENEKGKSRARSSGEATVHAIALRRSPRFWPAAGLESENAGGTVIVKPEENEATKINSKSVASKKQRKSPRFNSSSVEAECGRNESISPKSSNHQQLTVSVGDKELIGMNVDSTEVQCCSSRLSQTEEKCSLSEPMLGSPEVSNSKKESSERQVRRSPRFILETENGGSGESFQNSRISDCGLSAKIQLRRSPRSINCTKNGGSNESLRESEAHELGCSGKMQFRTSPRFSQATGSGASMNEPLRNFRSQEVTLSCEKHLRRSPRFLQCTKNSSNNESLCSLNTQDHGLFGEEQFRIYPKFSQATENCDHNGSFGKDGVEILDKKKLRKCSRFPLSLAGTESMKVNSTSNEFSLSNDEQPCMKLRIPSADSDVRKSDEEFLEQTLGAAAFPTATDKKDGRKSSLIELQLSSEKQSPRKIKPLASAKKKQRRNESTYRFIGDPIPQDEAQERWLWRYELKNQTSKRKSLQLDDDDDDDDDEDKIVSNVECHYAQADIEGCVVNLGDCVYIKGEEAQNHIGRILEFFKTTDGENYFRVQWFYRAKDTVMKEAAALHDKRRLFYSTVMNDNPIDCIISKVSVTQLSPLVGLKANSIPQSDFYFDMEYCVDYSTFQTLPTGPTHPLANMSICEPCKTELTLLDLYSGCGGMSTGLCLGAKLSHIDLVMKWAIESDMSACESFRLNHPKTWVRHETAEDFLLLLNEWEKLCKRFATDVERTHESRSMASKDDASPNSNIPPGELEVERLVDICYGDPCRTGKYGLKFKVRWNGYGASEDTWEPYEGLSNCEEGIRDFISNGFKSKILPLPGDVDVICGGPPCQGISGYNRYRNVESPLDDERNRQIIIFMKIVEYLKPKFVLMENVVDILRFDGASLARYALSRLVDMKYQARLGTIAAGCYGLPQFRLRVFLWGARPSEKLPQFPLPTHDVIIRYWPPPEFERNTVAYDEDQPRKLEDALVLSDAISDLPAVANHEVREAMPYGKPPETEFQRYIRSSKYEMTGSLLNGASRTQNLLYDHRPLMLFEDDYTRVCLIPKRKGANFRDLPGIIVGTDNVARRDPTRKVKRLPSGKPLVPDYVFTYEQGKSKRPFARLWWDETVPTVVTVPSCHNQVILHPEQDRILTIREYARLQGFPDYYRFSGTVKDRYCQIGNAVAVPVARALGYALGMAFQKKSGDDPLMTLPPKFSLSNYIQLSNSLNSNSD